MTLAEYATLTGITPTALQRKLFIEYGVEVTNEACRRWLNGTMRVSPKRMGLIEAVTGGKVTRYDERPDIFGEPPKQEAAE